VKQQLINTTTLFMPVVFLVFWAPVVFAEAEQAPNTDETTPTLHPSLAPDVRGDELKVKIEKGSFVVVPIPISNPTLGTALVVGAAHFYKQTAAQKQKQPASVTGAGAMYSDNGSRAVVFGNASYWDEDNWRFAGGIGYADLTLELLTPDDSGSGVNVDWRLKGDFIYAQLGRRIGGRWYMGAFGRSIDVDQTFSADIQSLDYDLGGKSVATGLGIYVERDKRDIPTNAYSGSLFRVKGLFNSESLGGDNTYQSYSAVFSSYYEMSDQLVLAWEAEGCLRSGTVPLWDACRVDLRGFAATDYLGNSSAIGQVEARWRMSERWGVVGFAGGGYVDTSFSQVDLHDIIPSYGIGLRFMVLKSKRINIRLDYGRSNDSDAIILSVGEAF
jgi:hypothetical protein